MKKQVISIMILLLLIVSCGKKKRINTPEYIMNQGLFFINEGKYKIAESKLKLALKKKPDLVGAINGLGIIYLTKREFEKSVKYFKRVISLNPQYIDAYNYLGIAYTELKKYDLAKENFLIAATSENYRNPENAYVNLAKLEIIKKNFKAALRYIEKGLSHNKSFAPLYNLKGIVYENLKMYSEAIDNYKKSLSILTEPDIYTLLNMARTYTKIGDKESALNVYEKALSTTKNQKLRTIIIQKMNELEK